MQRVVCGRALTLGVLAVAFALTCGCSRDDGNLRDAAGGSATYAALRAENEAKKLLLGEISGRFKRQRSVLSAIRDICS